MTLPSRTTLRRLILRRRPARCAPDRVGRFLFVGGLHRSGTTMLARYIAADPSVVALRSTRFPQDEGEHIQSALPSNPELGGPGRFAFHPLAHLTENSDLATRATRDLMLREWSPYVDLANPTIIEKSPSNLLRTRLLRALFPDASFVLIVRHPIAVTMATRKWCDASTPEMFLHWQVAHERLLADLQTGLDALVLRYEDLTATPADTLARVRAHTGLAVPEPSTAPRTDVNARYFEQWEALDAQTHALIEALSFDATFKRFGYALDADYVQAWPGFANAPESERPRSGLSIAAGQANRPEPSLGPRSTIGQPR